LHKSLPEPQLHGENAHACRRLPTEAAQCGTIGKARKSVTLRGGLDYDKLSRNHQTWVGTSHSAGN
jgi:hypothetical protein